MSSADNTLTLTRPDDWHLHLRDGEALAAVVGASARQFARAIVMPNLKPPVTTLDEALAYRARIMAALPEGADFTPLMTLYLTDRTPDEIRRAAQSGVVHAVKLYPAGATTHSDAGVTDLAHTHAALEAMQACGMPLLVHGEVTDPEVDVFDREAVFIDTVLEPLRRRFPDLRVVLEHITTREAAQYVTEAAGPIAATITAHHLLWNRNAIFTGLTPALVLSAGAQTGASSRGAGGGRHLRKSEVLSRHRQRAARGTAEGTCCGVRRLLHGAACAGALRHRL